MKISIKSAIFSLACAVMTAACVSTNAPVSDGGDKEAPESKGVLLLSFDDRNFDNWVKAIPLFKKYDAHATFFVSGLFDKKAVAACRKLLDNGHTVGLHGQRHLNAAPEMEKRGGEGYYAHDIAKPRAQCEKLGIPVKFFAYPNGSRNEKTDAFLLTKFDRVRGGLRGVRPYDRDGSKKAGLKPLVTDERVFFPVSELPSCRVLKNIALGEVYNTDIDEFVKCIERIGKKKEVLVLTSHGISPNAKGIHMKTGWLEALLKAAKENDVRVLSFDEIPVK